MEDDGNRGITFPPLFAQSDDQLNRELLTHLGDVADAVDSPKFLLILRNSVLTLLETPNQTFNWKAVHSLLTDEKFRMDIVNKLNDVTPAFWKEEWNKLWHVDEDPLFSKLQQRILKRRSLIVFWKEEWSTMPEKERGHAAEIISNL